ncbi:MAG: 16S rRNA (cytosine(967)-C(5))-methyltransferase RsmB [Bacilli bacterium]|nr:16S rRNA (cytosine(967)-C(5))-methyltransferase RsmB [Bacilli bacterium]
MASVRKIALEIINQVLLEDAYSNLLLNEVINSKQLKEVDKGLLTELVYGTITYALTLDYYLSKYISKHKVDDVIRNILRMAIYQIVYLDRIPNHAVVNEAVKLAKEYKSEATAFVNGVLRNFLRDVKPDLNLINDEIERLAITTSHPLWLVKMWVKQFSLEKAQKVCYLNNTKPHQYIRLNLFKDTRDNIMRRLNELGIKYETTHLNEALRIIDDNIANTYLYKEGFVYIQDLSSMHVAHILNPQPSDCVIDVCAAPGGKSTHCAELMQNKGEVYACDIHEHKINLINEHKERLGLSCIKPTLCDARKLTEVFEPQSFDRVLVDAPCSGFGVIRRKPEIKYNKKPSDIDTIVVLQKEIIDEAIKLVKPGGTLVYSTCTLNKKENEKMVEYILNKYQDFKLNKEPFEKLGFNCEGYLQLIDQINDADIFFIACFKKDA